ncbi:hypothetical protein AWB81_07792 [Caballeronia arationis]|uniref:hypothetical protein n=1 Tax=Caballeronia arationis TaxID=1777142 RepID=UPI00074C6E9C|nr:hypothetical protein [Caballeronia arationis]SAL06853.1 hypothetical protein AWB81_07792 [Caballeronia arationis]
MADAPNDKSVLPPEPKPSPILPLATVLPAVNSLVSTLAWPVFAVWVILFVANHHTALVCDIARLSPYIQTGEIYAGPFSMSVQTAQSIANALSAPAEGDLTPAPPEAAQKLATQAVHSLDASGIAAASTALRMLWVDPNPGNNINLQVAFQKLGFVVVKIQNDNVISEAFRLAQSFDVVITNMQRGQEGDAGLNTIKVVQSIQPGIPVIVYSAGWAQTNLGREKTYGVSLISNRTDLVFQKVVDIAQALIKPAPRSPAATVLGSPSLNHLG